MAFRNASHLGRHSWTSLAVLAISIAVAQPVRAENAKEGGQGDAKQEAKSHFTAGQTHYNLNEYAEALAEFKAAYRIFPDPVFLYNLAQCERRLVHYEEAISFYRSYLRGQPKAANRQEVQHKIDEMEAALKIRGGDAEPGLTPPVTAESSEAKREPKPAPLPIAEPAVGRPETEAATTASGAAASPVANAASSGSGTASAVETKLAPGFPVTPPVREESNPSTAVDSTDSSAPPPAKGKSPAFYQRWWFWTAAGVVAAGAGVGVYLMLDQGASDPSTALGSRKVF